MKQILNSNTDSSWPSLEINFYKKVELFIDSFSGLNPESNSFKIMWLKEAEEIIHFKKHVIENKEVFDAIITYDQEVLDNCDNSYFLAFGTAWVFDYDLTKDKTYQVSNITGHKEVTEGHRLRKKVHYKQNKIKIPKDFYISKFGGVENAFDNKVLSETKTPVFDSQFHICIENSRQRNYFTEKLIDCFITKTIPIYYGCENIGDFFETDGMLLVNNHKDILEACNSITPEFYSSKKEMVDRNFELAQKYITLNDRLSYVVNKILKNGNI